MNRSETHTMTVVHGIHANYLPRGAVAVAALAASLLIGCSTQPVAHDTVSQAASVRPDGPTSAPCCDKKTVASGGSVDLAATARPVLSTTPPDTATNTPAVPPTIPDVELVNQYGRPVHFYTDLVKGRPVAIGFFFTSCTTICPPLTATMSQVQRLLKEKGRDDIQLIFISVDPVTDTPTRLRSWSKNFQAGEDWAFLTGKKSTVDRLLKSLQSFTPDFQDHSPMILVGNEPKGVWKQVYGLASAADLCQAICDVAGPKAPTPQPPADPAPAAKHTAAPAMSPDEVEAARNYFTDTELIDQHGTPHRFYTDLLRDRVVIVSSFFASCTGVCPVLNQKLTAIRRAFPDRIGQDLFLLSISVDPLTDTPERLKTYAESLEADPGWYFLTGTKDNVDTVLRKLGMHVDDRENHSNILLVGNNRTGLWKKAFGLAPPADLAALVDSVLNDPGDSVH